MLIWLFIHFHCVLHIYISKSGQDANMHWFTFPKLHRLRAVLHSVQHLLKSHLIFNSYLCKGHVKETRFVHGANVHKFLTTLDMLRGNSLVLI